MTTPHRSSSTASSSQRGTIKFPDLPPSHQSSPEEAVTDNDDPKDVWTPSPSYEPNGFIRDDRWQSKRRNQVHFQSPSPRRSRQKSLSEAIYTIKERRGSVSDNAQELAAALKAPVSPLLVFLCAFWFMTSIFSNASSKSILIAFRQPVTLTLVQFAFVSSLCIFSSYLASVFPSIINFIPVLKYKIQPPNRDLVITTLPLTAFQIGGHILNSDAMSRIPVSLVHTIKGLSPLFTVVAYRFLFHINYSVATYLSLIPLTLGVFMACSANTSANLIGLTSAFGSTLLFVTQNIVSKKLFNEAARAEAEGLSTQQAPRKPDKLNLLCYSSGLAFLITFPIWIWSEGIVIVSDILRDGAVHLTDRPDALDHGRLALEYVFNGTFHFAQSLVAFILLSMVSPVTYSVASLIKRVFVISFAVVWFGSPMTRVQGVGIILTFLGLYLYDRTNDASRADRRARLLQPKEGAPLLPLISEKDNARASPSESQRRASPYIGSNGSSSFFVNAEEKRNDGGHVRSPDWLPPGTRQEDTWRSNDTSYPSAASSYSAKPNGVVAV